MNNEDNISPLENIQQDLSLQRDIIAVMLESISRLQNELNILKEQREYDRRLIGDLQGY